MSTGATGHGPEARLVAGASAGDRSGLLDAVSGDVDWSAVVALSERHGVRALLARELKALEWRGVPPPVVEDLTRYRASLTARNLFLSRRLLDVLDLLDATGVPAVAYKGPLLGEAAYGDLTLRPFRDLDVLVPRHQAPRAKSALLDAGYRSLTPRRDARHRGQESHEYAFPLAHPTEPVLVELHWDVAPSFSLAFEDVVARCREATLLGTTVADLSAEDSVLLQCVHGSKHAWTRLEWVSALAHTIDRTPALDWDSVARHARRHRATPALALGLSLARRVGGVDVPAEVLTPQAARRAHPVADEVSTRWFRSAAEESRFDNLRLRLRARSVSDRLRYCVRLARPSEKDLVFVRLPPALAPLYYAVRPVRVALEHTSLRRVVDRWQEARRREARRALERQLAHQVEKADVIRGREWEVEHRISRRWRRVERALAACDRPLPERGRTVEVGSGAHGVVFASGLPRAVGVDPLAAHYARLFPAWHHRIPSVAASGDALPFPTGAFELVLCDNVVDHAERPAAIVAELARVLAPGGTLYFTVNVHHPFYAAGAWAHRALNALGVPVAVGPFADHTVHLTPPAAWRLFEGIPLTPLLHEVGVAEARARARLHRPRRVADIVKRLFLKNARFVLVAERISGR